MKRLLIAVAAIVLIASMAFAQDAPAPPPGPDGSIHPVGESSAEHFRKTISRQHQVDVLGGHPGTRHIVDPGQPASAAIIQQWENGIQLGPLSPGYAPGPRRGDSFDVGLALQDVVISPAHPAPSPSQSPPTAYIATPAGADRSPNTAPVSVEIVNPPKAGKYAVTFAMQATHAPDAVAYWDSGDTHRMGQPLQLVPDGTASDASHWSTGIHIPSADSTVTICLFPPKSVTNSWFEMAIGPVVLRLL